MDQSLRFEASLLQSESRSRETNLPPVSQAFQLLQEPGLVLKKPVPSFLACSSIDNKVTSHGPPSPSLLHARSTDVWWR
jgi:hypothetical protein